MTKRQQAVCWSGVSQGSGRPVLEAARRHPRTSTAFRTSGIRLPYEVSDNPLSCSGPGTLPDVLRFVIPAKAGIQSGFRLVLRLAGMNDRSCQPLAWNRQLGSRTRCKIADEKLRFPLCCLLLESADGLSGFPYAGLFPHLGDPPSGEGAHITLHARFDQ
jgi:hypothetical protein